MADVGKLVSLVARLRAPGGCPWDREQQLADLRAYLLEEAHEAAAALDGVVAAERGGARGGDTRGGGARGGVADGGVADFGEADGGEAAAAAWSALAEELGDLLFQVAFVLRLGEEAGRLDAGAVVERVHAKMVERHPHVFPREGEAHQELADAAAVERAWERRKLERGESGSLLAGVPSSLPALLAAFRLTQKAAGVGFDWPDAEAVLEKVDEEVAELRAEVAAGDRPAAAGEVGDLLFTVANLGRKLGVDPEGALASTNAKFRRRFAAVEAGLAARGRRLGEADLAEMDELWEAAKTAD